MSHPDPDELTPTTAITQMLGAANSAADLRAVKRVGVSLGWLWTCRVCLEANYLEREACRECQEPRLVLGAPGPVEG